MAAPAHEPGDFPHFRTEGPTKGNCMCTEPCCQDKSGCRCKGCAGIGHYSCPAAKRHAILAKIKHRLANP